MSNTAELTIDGKHHELPIVEGQEGERAIVTTRLREFTGLAALDPAFGNTASCVSNITFIDGDKGKPLSHRPRKRFGQDRSPALIPHVTQ